MCEPLEIAAEDVVLKRSTSGLVGKRGGVLMPQVPAGTMGIVDQQAVAARTEQERKDAFGRRRMTVPNLAPMAAMVEVNARVQLTGLAHPIEMLLGCQLITQGILPVGPGKAARFRLFQQRLAIQIEIAQPEGVAPRLD